MNRRAHRIFRLEIPVWVAGRVPLKRTPVMTEDLCTYSYLLCMLILSPQVNQTGVWKTSQSRVVTLRSFGCRSVLGLGWYILHKFLLSPDTRTLTNEGASLSFASISSKVEAIVHSGGYINHSYKIFVREQLHLCLCLFDRQAAYIWTSYLYLDPDKDALNDLQRTVNEYELMAIFSNIMSACVAAPIALRDVEHEGKRWNYPSRSGRRLMNNYSTINS